MGAGQGCFLLAKDAGAAYLEPMRKVFTSIIVVCGLSACAIGPKPANEAMPADATAESGVTRPVARPSTLNTTSAARPPAGARTVEQFDTTSTAEKAAAAEAAKEAVASGEGKALGATIASLGDPAQPGLWIKTPLVSAPAKGRVVYPKNGKAVELDLIPLDGPKTAGSRMSLAALRVIEAPLTDLPEVQVFAN